MPTEKRCFTRCSIPPPERASLIAARRSAPTTLQPRPTATTNRTAIRAEELQHRARQANADPLHSRGAALSTKFAAMGFAMEPAQLDEMQSFLRGGAVVSGNEREWHP